jgi:hypothetical protein
MYSTISPTYRYANSLKTISLEGNDLNWLRGHVLVWSRNGALGTRLGALSVKVRVGPVYWIFSIDWRNGKLTKLLRNLVAVSKFPELS